MNIRSIINNTGLHLAVLAVVALAVRTVGQLSQVFVSEHVLFRGQDAWYHLRLAAYLRENWPHLLRHDWFANPLGQPPVGWPPVTTYVLGLPFLSEHQMEVWAAWVPPIMAIGIVVAVYFLALQVFKNKGFAFVTALLVAVLPTELFLRTMLGFTDHHMFEILFTALSLLFVLKLRNGIKWAVPLGVSLGLLFLTWDGAALIMATLTASITLQVVYMYFKRDEERGHIALSFALASSIALFMFDSYVGQSTSGMVNLVSLFGGGVWCLLLGVAAQYARKKLFLISIPCIGVLLVAAVSLTLPVVDILSGVFAFGDASVVSEMAPASLDSLFSNYGLALILGTIGLALYVKEREFVLPTFFVVLGATTLAHIRYGYYLTIPMCVFAVYAIHRISMKIRPRTVIIGVLILFVLASSATNTIRLATYENDITSGMYAAMTWLRERTPQPYADAEAFYAELNSNADYLVLTLWDYNHWLIYIGRRSPVTNAYGHSYSEIMQFFITGRDPSPYVEELYGKNIPIKYVVIDKNMLESNWLRWATGWKFHPYLNALWEERLPSSWTTAYENSTVKVLQKFESEIVPLKGEQ